MALCEYSVWGGGGLCVMQGPFYQIRDSALLFKTIGEFYTGFITLFVYNMVNITLLNLFYHSFLNLFLSFLSLLLYIIWSILLLLYIIWSVDWRRQRMDIGRSGRKALQA